jgi:hypothetical protein
MLAVYKLFYYRLNFFSLSIKVRFNTHKNFFMFIIRLLDAMLANTSHSLKSISKAADFVFFEDLG